MMADILLYNGDIVSDLYGDISLVTSHEEIIQSAINNIYTVYGENKFHRTLGNKIYNERLKSADSSLELIRKYCMDAVMTDNRVMSVRSIEATYDENNRHNVFISFSIMVADGKESVLSSTITIHI